VALAYSSKKDVLEPVRKAETNSCYSDGMSENSFAFSDADSAKHSQQPRKVRMTTSITKYRLFLVESLKSAEQYQTWSYILYCVRNLTCCLSLLAKCGNVSDGRPAISRKG
jgi:hypothetical protein